MSDQTTQTETPAQTTDTSLANQTDQTTTPKAPGTTDNTTTSETSLANQKDNKTEVTGAPEKYEAFKVPDGYELTEEGTKSASELFKKLNLNQAQSQELIDYYAKDLQKVVNGPAEYWQNMQKEWRDTITKDATYGDGNGKLKPEVLKAIADVKNIFSPELRTQFEEAMDLTGAGNHPAFIKGMAAIAKLLGEGTNVKGNGPSVFGQKAPGAPSGPGAAAMFPTLPSARGGS